MVLAVSGGPDSLALMHLAALWRDAGASVPLHVATVDHGLRPESGAEAAQVGRWARALGLPHETLVWRGDKPASGLQERAREARYALLFGHCRAIGAEAVVTAHHADDQWETILIRLARGSGLAGLAGMARDQIFPQGRLLRPLLDVPKQALIDFCRGQGQDFFTDPSNANPVFDRARWRAAAPALHALGLTPERLGKLGERARKADEALDHAAEELFRRTKMPESDVYDLQQAEDAPQAALERFLALAIERAAGAPPSRLERLELFALKLRAALRNGSAFRATLGRCAAKVDERKILTLLREAPRCRGTAGAEKTPQPGEFVELPTE
ncbi:tRNA lysidine(34) synthetase TilS [Rhodoblastus sp.]|uniref:tRNA lysidine(34) synthetase TilS n=1 Tax=Rhodoblastus sp. TaxID=1962975 RepID=UPI0025D67985|nr:tRNA lysidine(34) synthetase TilS [Rhodoblastus sp.]